MPIFTSVAVCRTSSIIFAALASSNEYLLHRCIFFVALLWYVPPSLSQDSDHDRGRFRGGSWLEELVLLSFSLFVCLDLSGISSFVLLIPSNFVTNCEPNLRRDLVRYLAFLMPCVWSINESLFLHHVPDEWPCVYLLYSRQSNRLVFNTSHASLLVFFSVMISLYHSHNWGYCSLYIRSYQVLHSTTTFSYLERNYCHKVRVVLWQ